MKRQAIIIVALLALLLAAGAGLLRSSFITFKRAPAASAIDASLPATITFNEDIQPVLSENCYFCHGQDSTARKADLRVDREEFAFLPRKNGQPVIVKGHPESSALIERISSKDPNTVMPPPSSHKAPLTDYQIALLTRWVKDGAQYQEHWAFVKPARPAPPEVTQPGWVKNPIDSFVLAKLESRGMAPEPEADRRSLIRRVTLDLTGLPPTPEEVSAFLADSSPDAYEKLVDRLLASPHYGEHAARYWLDAARYAETVGLHFDQPRSIWPYRDWVIKAFNDNKPFNDFVVEQVAGDLLPNATIDQQVATGFTRCGISTGEGGSIEDEVLATYAKEHVETNATVFLGLTMGCCACHDHKFDPISQKEFYEFSAFFRNTTQPALSKFKDVSVPPYIRVPAMADRPRWQALPGEMAVAQKAMDEYAAKFATVSKDRFPEIVQSLATTGTAGKLVGLEGLELKLALNEGHGTAIQSGTSAPYNLEGEPKWSVEGLTGPAILFDGTTGAVLGNIGDFDTKDKFSFGCWIRTNGIATGRIFARTDKENDQRGWELRLDDNRVETEFINSLPTNSVDVTAVKPLAPGKWQHVWVTYNGAGSFGGVKIYVDGIPQQARKDQDTLVGSIRTGAAFTLGGYDGEKGASGVAVQDLRVYSRMLTPGEIQTLAGAETIAALVRIPPEKMTGAGRAFALTYYLHGGDPKYAALETHLEKLKAEYDAISNRSPVTMVMNEKPTPPFAYFLKRGQYDQKGDKLSPGLPKVLPPMPKGAPNNRLGLAQWFVSPENPLLARVTVNRLWQQLFGIGIVRTSEDFGVMGERPVNQPLLDWMAVEFRESGWDVKHMYKLMAMSAAYRQSDRITPEKLEKDPENRFVSRGPRFRLDAEAIRDQALAASGLLRLQIGGPSVKPYQPPGLWEAVSMGGESTYKMDSGDGLYRRSMYTYLKRLAPQPQLTTFDAPSRELCTVRRERTNTPLQALAMENDPQYVEAARHLAVNAMLATADPAGRLDYMSERLLARPLDQDEQAILLRNLDAFHQTYTSKPEEAAELIRIGASPPNTTLPAPDEAAWTMIASEFLNLDETLNK